MLWKFHKQVPEPPEEGISIFFQPPPAHFLIVSMCKEQQEL